MRILLALCLTALLPFLAACGDATGPGSGAEGTYHLESINDEPLPLQYLGAEILSASITLNRNGTYSRRSTSRYVDRQTGQVVTNSDSGTGTYTVTGNTVNLTSSEGEQSSALYDGQTLTVLTGLVVAIYRRE